MSANERHWMRLAERGSAAALRAMAWSHRWLGRRLCLALLYPIVAYFYVRERAWRGESRRYLESVWSRPEGARRLSRRPGPLSPFRHYHEFASQIFDRMVLWGGGLDQFHMDHWNGHLLYDLARQRRGAILLGAHLGSFDMLRTLAREHGLVVNAVMYTEHAEKINRFFEQLDPESRVRVLQIDPSSVKTAFAVKACLDRGELVGILADRRLEGSREEPVWVDFLGAPMAFPRAPFLLACLLGCPTLLSVCVRAGDAHYRAWVEPLSDGMRLPRSEREKGAEELARTYVRQLEAICLEHPYQWFNFYDYSGARA